MKAAMKQQEPAHYKGGEVTQASIVLTQCADSDLLVAIHQDASELIGIERRRRIAKDAYRDAMQNNFTNHEAYKHDGSLAADAQAEQHRAH